MSKNKRLKFIRNCYHNYHFSYLLAEPVTVKVIMFNKSKNVERYLKPVIENPILTRKFGKCVTFQPEKGAMKVTVEVPLLTKVLSKIILKKHQNILG